MSIIIYYKNRCRTRFDEHSNRIDQRLHTGFLNFVPIRIVKYRKLTGKHLKIYLIRYITLYLKLLMLI